MSPLKDTDPAVFRMIIILATIIAGVVITWIKTKSVGMKVEESGAKIDEAKIAADKAAELALPISNGFAGKTLGQLEEIVRRLGPIETKLERIGPIEAKLDGHLQAHAAADVSRPHN